jgi:hypothetical protein
MTRTLGIAVIVMMMLGRTAAADAEQKQWRTAFFVSLALTVGAGVFGGVSSISIQSEADQIEATKANGRPITDEDCDDRSDIMGDVGGHFDSACAWRSRYTTATVLTLGFGIVTLATAYLAFRKTDDPPSSAVTVTPTIGRDGAGAQLQLRW